MVFLINLFFYIAALTSTNLESKLGLQLCVDYLNFYAHV